MGSIPIRGTKIYPKTQIYISIMLKIRLSRVGRKHVALYRIVLTEHTQAAKHGYIKVLGHYNPITKALEFDAVEAAKHVANGAQYSDTLANVLKRAA